MKGEASEAIVRGLKAAGVDFVAILIACRRESPKTMCLLTRR